MKSTSGPGRLKLRQCCVDPISILHWNFYVNSESTLDGFFYVDYSSILRRFFNVDPTLILHSFFYIKYSAAILLRLRVQYINAPHAKYSEYKQAARKVFIVNGRAARKADSSTSLVRRSYVDASALILLHWFFYIDSTTILHRFS